MGAKLTKLAPILHTVSTLPATISGDTLKYNSHAPPDIRLKKYEELINPTYDYATSVKQFRKLALQKFAETSDEDLQLVFLIEAMEQYFNSSLYYLQFGTTTKDLAQYKAHSKIAKLLNVFDISKSIDPGFVFDKNTGKIVGFVKTFIRESDGEVFTSGERRRKKREKQVPPVRPFNDLIGKDKMEKFENFLFRCDGIMDKDRQIIITGRLTKLWAALTVWRDYERFNKKTNDRELVKAFNKYYHKDYTQIKRPRSVLFKNHYNECYAAYRQKHKIKKS